MSAVTEAPAIVFTYLAHPRYPALHTLTWTTVGSDGTVYTVVQGNYLDGTCTCPAATKGRRRTTCKHVRALHEQRMAGTLPGLSEHWRCPNCGGSKDGANAGLHPDRCAK